MICRNCGRENDANSKFCVACGQSLAESEPVADTQILNSADSEEKAFAPAGAPVSQVDSTQIPAPAQQPMQTPVSAPVQPATPQYQYNAPAVGVQEMPKKKKSGKKIALAIVAVILVLIIGGGAAITVAVLNNPKVAIALAAKKFIKNDNGELALKLKANGESSTIRLKYEFNPSQKKCNLLLSLPDEIGMRTYIGESRDIINDFALYDGILFVADKNLSEETEANMGFKPFNVKDVMEYFWSIYDGMVDAFKKGDKETVSGFYDTLLAKAKEAIAVYDPDGNLRLSEKLNYINKVIGEYLDMSKADEAINTLLKDVKTEDFWVNYMGYEYTKEGDSKVYKIAPDIRQILDYSTELAVPALGDALADRLDDDVDYFKDEVSESKMKVEASVYITKGKLDKIEGSLKADGEKVGSAVLSFTNQGEVNIKNELGEVYDEAVKNSVTLKEYMDEVVIKAENKNTCFSNCNEIISTVNQYITNYNYNITWEQSPLSSFSFSITSDGVNGTVENCVGIDQYTVMSLFQAMPCCPEKGTYYVTYAPGYYYYSKDTVKVSCDCPDHV
ncbi:MAG: zinc ribbon domain-containing protein [Clostridiales bacterium]|nr:zinc ribbon domain-containing protein [Clostridiales bacterium]